MKKFKDIKQGDSVSILDQEHALLEDYTVKDIHREKTYIVFSLGENPNLMCLGYLEEFVGNVFNSQDGRRLPDLKVLASRVQKATSSQKKNFK